MLPAFSFARYRCTVFLSLFAGLFYIARGNCACKGRSRPAKGQGCGRAKKFRNAKSKADEAAEPVEPVESAVDFNSMDAPAEDAQSAQLANPNFPGDHASAEEPHA